MRALYVSLYSQRVGQHDLRVAFNQYERILDASNGSKLDNLIDFIRNQKINTLIIYNVVTILENASLSNRFRSFIKDAKDVGLKQVYAPVASDRAITAVAAYNNSTLDNDEETKFDGLITEFEFWQDGVSLEDYYDLLDQMNAINAKNSCGEDLKIGTYLGWYNNKDLPESTLTITQKIAAKTDEVFLHAYVPQPQNAPNYLSSRLELFSDPSISRTPKIIAIFSYEDSSFAAGGEFFMGDWFCHNKANGIDGVEEIFNGLMRSDYSEYADMILGTAHYEYVFADFFLRQDVCQSID